MRKLKNEELGRISAEEYQQATKLPVVIVLDNVRSLNNVGSVFRTSDAFRVEKICLCGITGKPPHREIHKTALGATESVPWEYFETTQKAASMLKRKGYALIGIEQIDESIALHQFQPDLSVPVAFIFGNEIKGIDPEVLSYLDQCIEIPQFGTKHSFNISISVGIVLWHYFLKRQSDK
jgi:tRNA G18 (ribose-2'-O)-methylase SpoU